MTVAALSGAAGLGYEMVWTRQLAASFGHELVAALGVTTALFSGMALGSLWPGRGIAVSERPAHWYVGLEFVIGLWALVMILLSPVFGYGAAHVLPVDASSLHHYAVAFLVPFVLLLPATASMGATLPALEVILGRDRAAGKGLGSAYAANTFGAVTGTLIAAFLVIPTLGLKAALAICASVNFLCAAAMWFGVAKHEEVSAAWRMPSNPASPRPVSPLFALGGVKTWGTLFATGLLGIGYEVLTIRVLGQLLENTFYTFATLLATYLLGTACGATLHGHLARRVRGDTLTTALVVATSFACTAGTIALSHADTLMATLKAGLPASVSGGLAAELAIAVVLFFGPTLAMGALFTHLAERASKRDGSVAWALTSNTLGAALAPIVFGPIAIPAIGALNAATMISLLYLVALPNLGLRTLGAGAIAGVFALSLPVSNISLRFVHVPPGGGVLWHRDGTMASVTVINDRAGDLHLQVNNHFRMGGTVSIRSDHREAHIPLLLHPNPKRALFLGLGTGATLSAAGEHAGLDIDGVELVPEVVQSFPYFSRSAPRLFDNDRIKIHVADARRFVKATDDRYDVVVADLFHPAIDGSGALYTVEQFQAIRERLAEGGLFCQWLPLHQLDLATLRIIVRSFLSVYPDASLYLSQFSTQAPILALVGGASNTRYPANWFSSRVRDTALKTRLADVDLRDDVSLFGLYLAGARDLSAFSGSGSLNTDDLPLVSAQAPNAAYAMAEMPAARLVALIRSFEPKEADVLSAPPSNPLHDRLSAYWRARNRFLEIGAQAPLGLGTIDFIAAIAPQLIDVVRMSPDFEPAYLPLIQMARELTASDKAAARHLLERVGAANPARPEARQLLSEMPVE